MIAEDVSIERVYKVTLLTIYQRRMLDLFYLVRVSFQPNGHGVERQPEEKASRSCLHLRLGPLLPAVHGCPSSATLLLGRSIKRNCKASASICQGFWRKRARRTRCWHRPLVICLGTWRTLGELIRSDSVSLLWAKWASLHISIDERPCFCCCQPRASHFTEKSAPPACAIVMLATNRRLFSSSCFFYGFNFFAVLSRCFAWCWWGCKIQSPVQVFFWCSSTILTSCDMFYIWDFIP